MVADFKGKKGELMDKRFSAGCEAFTAAIKGINFELAESRAEMEKTKSPSVTAKLIAKESLLEHLRNTATTILDLADGKDFAVHQEQTSGEVIIERPTEATGKVIDMMIQKYGAELVSIERTAGAQEESLSKKAERLQVKVRELLEELQRRGIE